MSDVQEPGRPAPAMTGGEGGEGGAATLVAGEPRTREVAATDRITPCLWFQEANAEEAVNFYVSLLPGSRVLAIGRYPESGPGTPGSVLFITFDLAGRKFLALNGSGDFPFSQAVSLIVQCEDQDEIDRLWAMVGEGGAPLRCGWIKDRYGMPWQIVPAALESWVLGDPERANRVMIALHDMVKIDIAVLRAAFEDD